MGKIDTTNYMKYDVIRYMPTALSTDDQWIDWHVILRKRFGNKTANRLWLKCWIARGGKTSNANTQELREYMKKQGFNIETTTLESLGDTVSGYFDTIGDVIKWTLIGGGVLAAIVIIMVLRKPKETAQVIAMATPQGRIAGAASKIGR